MQRNITTEEVKLIQKIQLDKQLNTLTKVKVPSMMIYIIN